MQSSTFFRDKHSGIVTTTFINSQQEPKPFVPDLVTLSNFPKRSMINETIPLILILTERKYEYDVSYHGTSDRNTHS